MLNSIPLTNARLSPEHPNASSDNPIYIFLTDEPYVAAINHERISGRHTQTAAHITIVVFAEAKLKKAHIQVCRK